MADIYVKEGESSGLEIDLSVLVGAYKDDHQIKDGKKFSISRYEVFCKGSKYVNDDGYDIWIERNNWAYETKQLGSGLDEESFVDEENVQIVKKTKARTFEEALKKFESYIEDAKCMVKVELN